MSEKQMNSEEFVCLKFCGETLCGIHHKVQNASTVVLVVVGGPQYRVGSHRQYVILARYLQNQGVACLRMDSQGMGDSTGHISDFTQLEDQLAAFRQLIVELYPQAVKRVLFGICDGASAIALSLAKNSEISHAILVNPWSQGGSSSSDTEPVKPIIYYKQRILNSSFWRKLLTGDVHVLRSLQEWSNSILARNQSDIKASYIHVMGRKIAEFDGDVLIQLSTDDLVAADFEHKLGDYIFQCRHVQVDRIEGDHTFSNKSAMQESLQSCMVFLDEGSKSKLPKFDKTDAVAG